MLNNIISAGCKKKSKLEVLISETYWSTNVALTTQALESGACYHPHDFPHLSTPTVPVLEFFTAVAVLQLAAMDKHTWLLIFE